MDTKRPIQALAVLGLVLALTGSGCGDDDSNSFTPTGLDSQVARDWMQQSLAQVRDTPGYSPPVAARAYAYLGVVAYESTVAAIRDRQSLAGQLVGLEPMPAPPLDIDLHWGEVVNAALAATLDGLFPTAPIGNQRQAAALAAVWSERHAEDASAETLSASQDYGRRVAAAVLAWAEGDGGDSGWSSNFPTDYVPPVFAGAWESTPPAYQRAMQPYWGDNRSMMPGITSLCEPGPPLPYSEASDSPFFAEALEVYEQSLDLSEEEREIALFWADDAGLTATPPGHSVSILTQILEDERASLAQAVEAYARVGIAVGDAFIACWASKFRYNLLRPITYLQALVDPAWFSMLNTPPFPEFTSGHSVQSGAAATVLTYIFGARAFVDHTHDERGLAPRAFDSFDDAASEAAISRLYGGIHFRTAIEVGVDQGRCIGDAVNRLRFEPDTNAR